MIAIIAAIAENNVIGRNGKIPWKILGEQRWFKELTMGNIVIMGRYTFEEIVEKRKTPLKNRITLLLSTTVKIEERDCHTFQSLEEALIWAKEIEPKKDIYIAGGGKVYQEALPYAQRLYLTRIEHYWEGDVYFPNIEEDKYCLIEKEFHQGEISYCHLLYERVDQKRNEEKNDSKRML